MNPATDGRAGRRRLACAGLLAFCIAPLTAAAADPCAGSLFASSFEDGEPGGLCQAEGLNDTGVQFCGEAASGDNTVCLGTEPLGQDADYGRDARAAAGQLAKFGAGRAGFDFSKISNAGTLLDAGAPLGAGAEDWACTRDNLTGLIWEVKIVDETSPRHAAQGYSWYEPGSADGIAGDEGATHTCRSSLGAQNCNTLNYAAAVNATGLCGASDWRLPTLAELSRLVDYGPASGTAVDPDYFPNTTEWWHWSSRQHAPSLFAGAAWYTHFGDGTVSFGSRANAFRVLLVRRAP